MSNPFGTIFLMFGTREPYLGKDESSFRTTSASDHPSLWIGLVSDPSFLGEVLGLTLKGGADESKVPVVALKGSARGLVESFGGTPHPSLSGEEEGWFLVRARDLESVADEVIASDPDTLARLAAAESFRAPSGGRIRRAPGSPQDFDDD